MQFVVTGTGRSGTGYTADLFTAAGLRCGHEQVFRATPVFGERAAPRQGLVAALKGPVARGRETLHRRRSGFDGDASWMAAPRLARFEGVSFLQLRHPLPVIRSFMGTRFFSEPSRNPGQHGYAAAFFTPTGDDMVDAMRWWVFWNDLAREHATVVYRLEDLDEFAFAGMLDLVGAEDPALRAAEAFHAVPADVNSSTRRGDRPGVIGWGDLPTGEARDRLESAMLRYGYDRSGG